MKFFETTTVIFSTFIWTALCAPQPTGNDLSFNKVSNCSAPHTLSVLEATQNKWILAFEGTGYSEQINGTTPEKRQVPGTGGAENWVAAERALQHARSNSAAEIRRRRLQQTVEGRCTGANRTPCERCMDFAVVGAVGEIMACGSTALGVAAFTPTTAGVAAFLAAAGFIGCDLLVAAQVGRAWIDCVRVSP